MPLNTEMKILGVSEGSHDAGVALIDDDTILHASASERYSRVKGDSRLHHSQEFDADVHAFFERPLLKNTRRLFAGQRWQKQRRKYDHYFGHHKSHAAAGYYTSPFDSCNALVIDAIGEWDTTSVWECAHGRVRKLKSWKYPKSLGLLYSAVTQRIGLRPNEDEYVTMGMAAFGEPIHDLEHLLHENCHLGIGNAYSYARLPDLAASVQKLYEDELLKLVAECSHENLVLMGGCAQNSVANSKIEGKNIWIMPSPGDSGSALGAAALVHRKKLRWDGPYLGENIDREINPMEVVQHLLSEGVCGVANGRAEFGPRALGNRSLLADPRLDIKDHVNRIKRRQAYRPFAPAILAEYYDDYFDGPANEYMQFVSQAKHDHKSVTHVDGTARVQMVKPSCQSVLRPILEEWYDQTGCPMLLNTSLNIRGMPMVNTWEDAKEFEREYQVQVF